MDEKENKEREADIKKAVAERTITLILGGLGLVVALAWNDAIQAFFKSVFGDAPNSIVAKFIYALLLTVIITIVSIRLARFTSRE